MPGEQFRTPIEEALTAGALVKKPNETYEEFMLRVKEMENPLVKVFESGGKCEHAQQEYLDGPLWALKRIGAITYEGMNRYGKRNWRKGMPVNETFNHIMNHLLLWAEGDRSEDHLAKAAWGIMVLIVEDDIAQEVIKR